MYTSTSVCGQMLKAVTISLEAIAIKSSFVDVAGILDSLMMAILGKNSFHLAEATI